MIVGDRAVSLIGVDEKSGHVLCGSSGDVGRVGFVVCDRMVMLKSGLPEATVKGGSLGVPEPAGSDSGSPLKI